MKVPGTTDTQNEAVLEKVIALAKANRYEEKHSLQVTKLALKLFNEMKSLHGLGPTERLWLRAAGLLHDIGWVKGRKGHHKTARDIILRSTLPFDEGEKKIIALVARYHRRALPEDTHKYYSDLNSKDKDIVNKLASFLRIADGLDRRHINSVDDLVCEVMPKHVIIKIRSDKFSILEKEVGRQKSDLFESVFKKAIVIDYPFFLTKATAPRTTASSPNSD